MSLATDADDLVASGALVDDVAAIGDTAVINSTTATAEVTAGGVVHADDGATTGVRLRVPAGVRRAGFGPIDLELNGPGVALVRATLIWIVATNKGWVHMRGEATATESLRPLPFRADLFAAAAVRGAWVEHGPDRFALRIYAADDDPNRASPIVKVGGWMESGSIRL